MTGKEQAAPSDQTAAAIEDAQHRQRLLAALINVRVAQGMSQSDVARRLGLAQSTVSAFESGLDSSLRTFQRYARACGAELRTWLVPKDAADREELAKTLLSGFQGGRWINVAWEDLSPQIRHELLSEADTVLALMDSSSPPAASPGGGEEPAR